MKAEIRKQRAEIGKLATTISAFCFLLSTFSNAQPLADRIDPILATPSLAHAVWGIDVEDDAGNVLYAHGGGTLMIPASNRKLFNAVTAANCVGLDHQFTTELWLDGADVVLRGGGDPSLGGRWTFDRDALFAPFVAALRAHGIRTIEGDLIADVSAFDRTTIPGSWKVGNIGSEYSAPVDALDYNENVVGVTTNNCAHPVVTTDPPFVIAAPAVTCGAATALTIRSTPLNTLAVTGTLNGADQELVAIADPALYAAQALRDALHHAGIELRGQIRVNGEPRVWREKIAEIASPPLWQLLSVVLKPSQNLYAETIYKDITFGAPGSYAASADVERRFLTTEIGVDGAEFHFVDGCGLSPDDWVAPSAIVRVLRWMNDPSRRGAWWMMLATPGEEGTLHRRLLELAARLRGKTGSIAGVNALSGIVAGTRGGFRYFSIVINHHTADSGEALRALDAIARVVADF